MRGLGGWGWGGWGWGGWYLTRAERRQGRRNGRPRGMRTAPTRVAR